MHTFTRQCILLCLFCLSLPGCRDRQAEPSESVRKMKTCRRLMEDSAAVVLMLKKGMNDFELEVIERERSLGLQACLRRHPDLPGRCLDLTSRKSIQGSVEIATTFCMSWPQELIDCVKKQDLESPGCRKTLEAFRRPVEPPGKKD